MTSEQIYEKLDNLYAAPASKNFVNHLIRAYFPINKVNKVLSKPAGKFRCLLTNEPLCSVDEVLAALYQDEVKNQFIDAAFQEFSNVPPTNLDQIVKLAFKNKKLGLTGESTDTFISWHAYKDFFNWVSQKILNGDKNINWIIKEQMAGDEKKEKKENKPDKIKAKPKESQKTTLGDLPALQALKNKLEAEEQNQK